MQYEKDNNTQEEKSAYQKAFALLRDGKYDMATQEFKEFLSHYPQGSYADNAQYWLGEINYVQRKFDLALAEFNKVLNKFPNSPKYADAMLKIGLTYYELEYWDQARKVFNDLVSKFPNTAESQIAEKRLQQMKVDGHS